MIDRDNIRDFLTGIQANKDQEHAAIKSATSDRKNVLDLNILVVLDISGSISTALFLRFMQKMDAIKGLSRIKVVETDTEIVALYDYHKSKTDRVIRVAGGGGTEFNKAFALAKRIRPDAILLMTDGEVSGTVSDPGIPTGWVMSNDKSDVPYGFGEIVSYV